MKFKVAFLPGAYRTVDADHYVIDDRLLVFMKDEKPVLTAVLANVCYFHNETESLGVPLGAQVGLFESRV